MYSQVILLLEIPPEYATYNLMDLSKGEISGNLDNFS